MIVLVIVLAVLVVMLVVLVPIGWNIFRRQPEDMWFGSSWFGFNVRWPANSDECGPPKPAPHRSTDPPVRR